MEIYHKQTKVSSQVSQKTWLWMGNKSHYIILDATPEVTEVMPQVANRRPVPHHPVLPVMPLPVPRHPVPQVATEPIKLEIILPPAAPLELAPLELVIEEAPQAASSEEQTEEVSLESKKKRKHRRQ